MVERKEPGRSVSPIIERDQERQRRLSQKFRPGVLEALEVLLARVVGEVTVGSTDTEAGYEQSIDSRMTPEQAISYCRTDGCKTKQIVDALVDPAVLRPRAFRELSPDAVGGIKSRFVTVINNLFWHRD